MIDPFSEAERFLDHNLSAVDALATALFADAGYSNDFVIFIADSDSDKGRELAELSAQGRGISFNEACAHASQTIEAAYIFPLPRMAAVELVKTWNAKAADILSDDPGDGAFWIVVLAAGLTRIVDRVVHRKHTGGLQN